MVPAFAEFFSSPKQSVGGNKKAFLEKTNSVLKDEVSGARGPPILDAIEITSWELEELI